MEFNADTVLFIGYTSTLMGELLVAYAAIAVHHRFRHEHKVDEAVFKIMRREQQLAVIGIILFISGYLCKVSADFLLV